MWDAVEWARTFAEAAAIRDGEALHACRLAVWRDTTAIVRAGGYEVGTTRVTLDAACAQRSQAGTAFYADTAALVVDPSRQGRHRTTVTVHNADSLEIARAIDAPDCPTAVLHMASRRNPGGGVDGGAGAQEENLFRRSNAFCSLYQFVDYGADRADGEAPAISACPERDVAVSRARGG